MGFGFSNTSSLTIGTNSPKEREHLFQFGFWAPKRKLFVAYEFVGEGKPPRNIKLEFKMPKFTSLQLAIIFSIGTAAWSYSYRLNPGQFMLGTVIVFLLLSAFYWNEWLEEIRNAKSKKASKT